MYLGKAHYRNIFSIYLILLGLIQIISVFLIKFDMSDLNTLIIDYGVIPFEFLFIYYLYFKEAETTFAKKFIHH